MKEDNFNPGLALSKLSDSLIDPNSRAREIAYPLDSIMNYLEMLARWSKRIDLVSPGSEEELFRRHVIDSYAALLVLFHKYPRHLLEGEIWDIGSGAGLPGIIIALALPDSDLRLVEPREKRVLFLKEVCRELGLDNVNVIRGRMEDILPNLDKQASLILCRALGLEEQYLSFCDKALSKDSLSVQLLGPSWNKPERPPKGLNLEEIIEYELPQDKSRRKLAIWKKV